MSSSTRHDPPAIWAHLQPVLTEVRARSNKITTAHFVSDGPTTQYRNKKNFYLTSTLPFKMGVKWVTWNFLEAGHGKGAADGIGGAIKRDADRLVSEGKDIPDAESLFEALQRVTSVNVKMVSEEEIRVVDDEIPTGLCLLPGTMKTHQLIAIVLDLMCAANDPGGHVSHRILSCFCKGSKSPCPCFGSTTSELQSRSSVPPKANDAETRGLLQPIHSSDDLLDKWCIVFYDQKPYPGKIVDFDEDAVEVKSMQRVGNNMFFWPMREDRIWYEYDNILALIPEPRSVGSHNVEVDKDYWTAVCNKLDV